jgi:hypothetical protein
MRSKCLHEKAKPPCKACGDAGLTAADCIFPVRGASDALNDREYRHPRLRAEKNSRRDPSKARHDILDTPIVRVPGVPVVPPPKHTDDWDLLPPLEEIIDGVDTFTKQYFQLGFIPKVMFPDRLRTKPRSVSVFLLLSILCISSRFTEKLRLRYGGGMAAVDYFLERAAGLALSELYQEPTLERCQGFYLLSIGQQGNGMMNASYVRSGRVLPGRLWFC